MGHLGIAGKKIAGKKNNSNGKSKDQLPHVSQRMANVGHQSAIYILPIFYRMGMSQENLGKMSMGIPRVDSSEDLRAGGMVE